LGDHSYLGWRGGHPGKKKKRETLTKTAKEASRKEVITKTRAFGTGKTEIGYRPEGGVKRKPRKKY